MIGALPVASVRDTVRTVGGLLARRRGLITATVALLLTGSASALTIPPVLGWIVDIVLSGDDVWRIPSAAGVLVAAGVVSATTAWWGGRLLVVCVQGVLAELREDVFTAAMRIDATTVERAGSSDVVSRLTGDVEAVTEAGSGVLPRFVGALFTIVLTAVGIAALDPFLALAALIAVPLQVIAVTRFLRRSRPLYVRLRREESDRGQAIIESVAGADTVRAHGLAPSRLRLIAERSLTAVETARTAGRARNVFNGTLNLAEFAGLAAVLTVGFWRVETIGITVGTVTAAALFFHRLFGPIGALLSSIDDLQRAQAGLERLVGLVQSTTRAPQQHPIRDASVELRHVTYTYPGSGSDRPAIADVSIRINPGRVPFSSGRADRGNPPRRDSSQGSPSLPVVPCSSADSRQSKPCRTQAGQRSCSSRKKHTCSPARSPTTCAWPAQTPPMTNSEPPSTPSAQTGSATSRTGSTPPPRGTSTCKASSRSRSPAS